MRLGQGPAAPLTHGNKHLPHISRQEPDATTMPRYIVHVQVLHRCSENNIQPNIELNIEPNENNIQPNIELNIEPNFETQ